MNVAGAITFSYIIAAQTMGCQQNTHTHKHTYHLGEENKSRVNCSHLLENEYCMCHTVSSTAWLPNNWLSQSITSAEFEGGIVYMTVCRRFECLQQQTHIQKLTVVFDNKNNKRYAFEKCKVFWKEEQF